MLMNVIGDTVSSNVVLRTLIFGLDITQVVVVFRLASITIVFKNKAISIIIS